MEITEFNIMRKKYMKNEVLLDLIKGFRFWPSFKCRL